MKGGDSSPGCGTGRTRVLGEDRGLPGLTARRDESLPPLSNPGRRGGGARLLPGFGAEPDLVRAEAFAAPAAAGAGPGRVGSRAATRRNPAAPGQGEGEG